MTDDIIDVEWEDVDEPEIAYQYVIGLDPGGTTGVAALRYTEDTKPELIYLHQIEDGIEGYTDWFEGSNPDSNVVMVSEKFTPREGVYGADLTPIYIEGVQYAHWRDDIVYQDPSQKSLIKDEWLKEQNLWTPGKRHQMDALIHALVYLRNSGHAPTLEALNGDTDETIAQEGEAEQKQLAPQGGEPADGEGDSDSEQGEPGDGDGEQGSGEAGEGEGQPQNQASVEAIQEVMKALQEAAEKAQPGDGKGNGPGRNTPIEDYTPPPLEEPKGKRKSRERNGVFAGFEPETDGVEVELYSD